MLGLARRRGRGWAPAQPPLAAASVLAAPASVLSTPAVTIRPAFPDDAQALARLAALDSAQSPPGPVLVAEVDGELRAALSIADGSIVADPFHRTAALLELLSARAAQLREEHVRVELEPGRWRVERSGSIVARRGKAGGDRRLTESGRWWRGRWRVDECRDRGPGSGRAVAVGVGSGFGEGGGGGVNNGG